MMTSRLSEVVAKTVACISVVFKLTHSYTYAMFIYNCGAKVEASLYYASMEYEQHWEIAKILLLITKRVLY